MKVMQKIRSEGINCELYPEPAKMKKQLAYADKKQIPWVVLIGKNEITNEVLSVKNMKTGEQQHYNFYQFIQLINS